MKNLYTSFKDFKLNESEEEPVLKKMPSKRWNVVYEDEYFKVYKPTSYSAMEYIFSGDMYSTLWNASYENFVLIDKYYQEKLVANLGKHSMYLYTEEEEGLEWYNTKLCDNIRDTLAYLCKEYCENNLIISRPDLSVSQEIQEDDTVKYYLNFGDADDLEPFLKFDSRSSLDIDFVKSVLSGEFYAGEYYYDLDEYYQYIDYTEDIKKIMLKLYSDDEDSLEILKDEDDELENMQDVLDALESNDGLLLETLSGYIYSNLETVIYDSIHSQAFEKFNSDKIIYENSKTVKFKIELTPKEFEDFIVILGVSNNNDNDDLLGLIEQFGYDSSVWEPRYGFAPNYSESGYIQYLKDNYNVSDD